MASELQLLRQELHHVSVTLAAFAVMAEPACEATFTRLRNAAQNGVQAKQTRKTKQTQAGPLGSLQGHAEVDAKKRDN